MTGIFDVIGTPQERQEKVLRKALEARREAFFVTHVSGEGYEYQGGGDLLLRHGQFYSGRELPEQYAHLKGTAGRCFLNALDAVRREPSLTYVEGVYAIGDSHYTPHAWCLDPDGQLLEVSLPTGAEAIREGRRSQRGLPVLGLEHWGYWGVVLHPDLVEFVIEAQEGNCGVLDRPTADAREGNPHTMEWRSEWPFLRLLYDPDRRTL